MAKGKTNAILGLDIGILAYSYTGESELIDDGDGNWRVKFLTSGVFVPKSSLAIDVFLVGGGGGGCGDGMQDIYRIGGGGGYTKTFQTSIAASSSYTITIGAGGAGGPSESSNYSPGSDGGTTSAFDNSVEGGKGGKHVITFDTAGDGGSGGGVEGKGGSDGSDGFSDSDEGKQYVGKGQGTTTREFGETSGTLYSGGGGGANTYGEVCLGGDGGGGNGATYGNPATSGETNTGGGGGCGAGYYDGASGGSGIVIIRNKRS